ncbi:MAG: hypothetical protein ACOYH4_06800 [Saccharofermentanales bacterium]|jgi:DNA-binding winged helix-turn-helix (wHTH) protein
MSKLQNETLLEHLLELYEKLVSSDKLKEFEKTHKNRPITEQIEALREAIGKINAGE